MIGLCKYGNVRDQTSDQTEMRNMKGWGNPVSLILEDKLDASNSADCDDGYAYTAPVKRYGVVDSARVIYSRLASESSR
jgi:hypothetical protein